MGIERYRSIVDDWPAFEAARARPEPVTLRVRAGRISAADVVSRLEAQGFRLEPLGVPADVFRVVDGPFRVSRTLEHWLGLFYIQQAVTALAAPALGVRPGERVLDMAAAPGGKTTHLADLMDDGGCLVAADRSEKRLRALLGNVYRTLHANVTVLSADGRTFPDGVVFDRVLVDAPCSGEGNLRSRGGEVRKRKASFSEHILGMQRALLRRAVALARPGGVVLYVTCTFAPEENEGVVDRILAELPVRMEPIDLEAPHAPGLNGFEGRTYREELRHAWRLYPHHMDSGGLFMARLRKEGGAPEGAPAMPSPSRVRALAGAPGVSGMDTGLPPGISTPLDVPVAVAPGDANPLEVAVVPGDATPGDEARARVERAVAWFEDLFAVRPEVLRSFRWFVRGDSLWMSRVSGGVPDAWPASDDWRLVSTGLRAFKEDPRGAGGARPTNDLLRWLDHEVGARVVELDEATALRVVEREPLDVGGLSDGLAALRLDGRVVGRGRVRAGRLLHEIPKAHARALAEVLMARREGVF